MYVIIILCNNNNIIIYNIAHVIKQHVLRPPTDLMSRQIIIIQGICNKNVRAGVHQDTNIIMSNVPLLLCMGSSMLYLLRCLDVGTIVLSCTVLVLRYSLHQYYTQSSKTKIFWKLRRPLVRPC